MANKKSVKRPKIKPINNFVMLAILSVFQIITAFCAAQSYEEFEAKVIIAAVLLIVTEWVYLIGFYTLMHRRNFELELIAFFLCGTGISVIGSVNAESALKQYFMVLAGIIIYIFMVFILGKVDLCMKLRMPVAVCAILLLIVNLAIAKVTNGARNWITIGGITFSAVRIC